MKPIRTRGRNEERGVNSEDILRKCHHEFPRVGNRGRMKQYPDHQDGGHRNKGPGQPRNNHVFTLQASKLYDTGDYADHKDWDHRPYLLRSDTPIIT
jgi:hypothetical protein